MSKKPTIAGLQRELKAAQDEVARWRLDAARMKSERDQKEAERARAQSDFKWSQTAHKEMAARCSFLEGKIEGMQWMLQQTPQGDGQ